MTEKMVNEKSMTRPKPNTVPVFFGSRQYNMSAAMD